MEGRIIEDKVKRKSGPRSPSDFQAAKGNQIFILSKVKGYWKYLGEKVEPTTIAKL